MSGIQFLGEDDIANTADGDRMAREVVVKVHLRAPTGGRIGPVLDQIRAFAEQAGLLVDMEVPGYHDTFYGLESDQDDAA